MNSTWLTTAEWLAVFRIGVGLWWLQSFRHKDLGAWLKQGAGISWGASVAEKHKWPFVKTGFDKVVKPHPIQWPMWWSSPNWPSDWGSPSGS